MESHHLEYVLKTRLHRLVPILSLASYGAQASHMMFLGLGAPICKEGASPSILLVELLKGQMKTVTSKVQTGSTGRTGGGVGEMAVSVMDPTLLF